MLTLGGQTKSAAARLAILPPGVPTHPHAIGRDAKEGIAPIREKRRRRSTPIQRFRAFSGEVCSGSPWKMRPNMDSRP
jgi:hypothetical protein